MQIIFIRISIYFQVASANNHAQLQIQDSNSKRNLKALKNLSMIMGLFILCWVPFLTYCIICVRTPAFCLEHQAVKIVYMGTSSLFLINSVVNPIVYAVRFRGFGVAFRLMFGRVKEDERHDIMEIMTSAWTILRLLQYGIEHDDDHISNKIVVKSFSPLVNRMPRVSFTYKY